MALRTLGRRLSADAGGVALIEFALLAPILVLMLANVVDFSRLIWDKMQSDNAAQMGVQAAYKTCASGTMPAKTNCTNLSSSVTTAVQSTSLGSNITLASSSYPEEYYYCACDSTATNGCTANTLVQVGTYSSKPNPFTCSGYSTNGSSISPGDYVLVDVSYSFTPLFSNLSLATSRTLSSQAMVRLQ